MIAVALIAAILGADVECGRHGDRCRAGSNRGKSGLAWFEAFPTSGAGLPSVRTLCGLLEPGEKAGDYWCVNGDGTTDEDGRTIEFPGGEVFANGRVCPSGPDCAVLPWIRYDANTIYSRMTNYNPASRGFTACFWGRVGLNTDTVVMGDWVSAVPSSGNWYLNGQGRFGVITTTSTPILVGNMVAMLPGEVHLLCGTVDAAGNPAAFVDGTKSTAGAATVRATAASNTTLYLGYNSPIGNNMPTVLGAFATNVQLSDARIAQLARLVLADTPTGARGEALTFTRASSQFCESSDSTGTMLPANRICVTRGGTTAAQGLYTEYLLRTEELDNAAWTDVGTPTTTANATVSPGGTLTAERLADDSTSAFEGRAQSVSVTAGQPYTMSCYVLAGTAVKVRLSLDGTTSDTSTLSAAVWTRVSVTDASASGASISAQVLVGTAVSDTGNLYAWGCNVTDTAALRPYVAATSAAVTSAAEVPYFTLTGAPALASVEATVHAPATYTTNARVWSVYKDANNLHDAFINTGGGNVLGCFYYVGGVSYTGNSAVAVSPSASHRLSCSYTGTHVVACVDGACNSTALTFTLFSGATRIYVGAYSLGTSFNFNPAPVIKSIKADSNPARFR